MRGRILVIALAAVAVAIAFTASKDDAKEPARDRAALTATPPPGAVRVSFMYSPEKKPLIAPLVQRFNAERHTAGGRPVFIDAKVVPSGDVEAGIAKGRLKPVLWSPASSFWGRLLNYEADDELVGDRNPSIVRTPLVIALWQRLADAYGYPKRPLGFGELARLATGGWAAAGKPAFGPFKYVHTNPDVSTAGLSAVAASYYAAVGKKEGLTPADVARGRAKVRQLERSIVHYGDTTLFIEQEMQKRGLGYASAAAMEETTLIHFNRHAGDGEHLVAVYPREGTFYSDNPLITLKGGWVTAEQRRAAAVFGAFLARVITPEVAGAQGFRPANDEQAPAGLVTAANGVDPKQPKTVLRLPEPKVLHEIKSAWRADRKPANVLMVLDISGSMTEEGRMTHARAGLKAFLHEVTRRDRVGLMTFSDDSKLLVPIAPMSRNRRKLIEATDRVAPLGGTRLRDTIADAMEVVGAHAVPNAINAVVVLTDGDDNGSVRTEDRLAQALEQQTRESRTQIRVFTIAYAGEPNERELVRYAAATGGRSYSGDQSDVESIYRKISSFF
jgi:Ca-activated chloride channel homolog